MKSLLPILMYHEIRPNIEKVNEGKPVFKGRCLSTLSFESQMRYLYENGYECVALDDAILVSRNRDKKANKKQVAITFDDGYAGNYLYALPILKKYGFMATFFVVVDWIGKDNMLTWKQIIDLRTSGMSIQSHTFTHRPLQYLDVREIQNEMIKSKTILEKQIGDKINFLSLPHGRYNSRVLKTAREVGYKTVFTSDIDFSFQGGKFTYGRIEIFEHYDLAKFAKIVESNYFILSMLKVKKILSDGLKKLLGFQNYRKISRIILSKGHKSLSKFNFQE